MMISMFTLLLMCSPCLMALHLTTSHAYQTPLVCAADMSTQQMIDSGKKHMNEVDSALKRSEKVVEDTIAIATTTAVTLHKQTEQLERTLDSLDEVHFTLKKAKQVIRDITRGIATDKCVAVGVGLT